jgi:hypothetical protein
MEEEKTPQPNEFFANYAPRPPKPGNGVKIIGYNLLALTLYSALCLPFSGGLISDAYALFFHCFLCFALAILYKSGLWLLSGLLVLVIGFSTCASFGHIDIR